MCTPCPVSVSELISQPVSWCKVEALALRSDLVTVVKDLSPPPLTVMSISLKTIQNPKTHHNEVRTLSAVHTIKYTLSLLAGNVLDSDRMILCHYLVMLLYRLKYLLSKDLILCRLCPWLRWSTISSIWTKLHLNPHTRTISAVSYLYLDIIEGFHCNA